MDEKSIESMLPEQDVHGETEFPLQTTYWEELK